MQEQIDILCKAGKEYEALKLLKQQHVKLSLDELKGIFTNAIRARCLRIGGFLLLKCDKLVYDQNSFENALGMMFHRGYYPPPNGIEKCKYFDPTRKSTCCKDITWLMELAYHGYDIHIEWCLLFKKDWEDEHIQRAINITRWNIVIKLLDEFKNDPHATRERLHRLHFADEHRASNV